MKIGDAEVDHARADPGRAATRPSSRGSRPRPASRVGPPTSTRRWPTRAYSIYFDAQTTDRRVGRGQAGHRRRQARLLREAHGHDHRRRAGTVPPWPQKAGVKNGVVQDKLWLPGLLKLKTLRDTGFFGRILSVRGEFGYWVFEGDTIPAQRPSWNYRKEQGGGIIIDMLCHWRYVLDNLFGQVRPSPAWAPPTSASAGTRTARPYDCTADDAAYAMFELTGGIVAQFNSSWCVRVRRDDLLVLQVDGTKGTAVAGLRDCWVQPYGATPRPVWNPDVDSPIDYYDGWQQVPESADYDNAFKAQWELFLRHVVRDEPFRWTLLEGAKGVQLAEVGLESWQKRQWVPVPELKA